MSHESSYLCTFSSSTKQTYTGKRLKFAARAWSTRNVAWNWTAECGKHPRCQQSSRYFPLEACHLLILLVLADTDLLQSKELVERFEMKSISLTLPLT